MKKAEFYNKVVNVYRNTGQGTPMFVAERLGITDTVEACPEYNEYVSINKAVRNVEKKTTNNLFHLR